MATTSSASLRYPLSTAAPNVPQDIQNLATDLDTLVTPHFTSIAERDAEIPVPAVGQACTVDGLVHRYDGASWRFAQEGFQNDTSDAGGNIVVGHGLGVSPVGVIVTPAAQANETLKNTVSMHVESWDSLGFTVYLRRDDTSTALASTQTQFSWRAFV